MFQCHHLRKHTTADAVKDKFVVLSQPILLDEKTLDERTLDESEIGDENDTPSESCPESSDNDQPGLWGQDHESDVTYEQIRYRIMNVF